MGMQYTHVPVANEDKTVPFPKNSDSDDENMADLDKDPFKLWHYCNQPSSRKMIMCDSKNATTSNGFIFHT